jgi:uncharacterized protein YndB with AHSA1/START domain
MDSVRKEITVDAPPERAFRVFTDKFDLWWPREHHIGKAELKKAVIEPRAGGRWYEIGTDGSECDWGRVLVWDPPKRLVMAWQLNAQWEYDANFVTELELRFTPVGPLRTRVELEHRNMDRFGEQASATREALESPTGWNMHLTLFAKTIAEEESANA